MISGHNILCISNTTWYGPITKSTVQLVSRLAASNRVLFVEYPYTWKDVIQTLMGKGRVPVKRILGLKNRVISLKTDQDTRVHHMVVPPVFPCDFIKNDKLFQLVFRLNAFVYGYSVKRALKKLGMSNVISVSAYNPFYGLAMKGKFREILNVYYSYDGPNRKRHGNRIYSVDAGYSRAADAVITTSDYLASEKKKYNPECFVVKNGVDFDAFSGYARISDFRRDKVRIGYIGSMDFRFDIDMVESAVKALPQYEFHFTGGIRNEAIRERLSAYPNVVFSAAVKPEEVPALLAGYDAGIIPYLQNEINKNIYPLKINEYLAVGVPVIMSRFSELPEFQHIVEVAVSPGDFVQKVESAVESDSPGRRKERIQFASLNSWDRRAEEFSSVLETLLEAK